MMRRIPRATALMGAIILIVACGAPEADQRGSGAPVPSDSEVGEETGTLRAVGVESDPDGGARAPIEPPGAAKPADRFELVSNLWAELDGEDARLRFTIELENATPGVATPTFLKIEQQNWVVQNGGKRGVGGGTIGIRRPLELAPGERAFMHRGDFTTLDAAEFRRGAYAGAGMTGAVTLQDEDGATFALPFDHAVKFSVDEGGRAVSEVWDEAPMGAPTAPAAP